jgi:hypothetical protein
MQGEAICLRNDLLGTWLLHGKNLSQGDSVSRCAQYDALCRALQDLVKRYPAFAAKIGLKRQRRRYSRCYTMAGFYAGRESNWPLARSQFTIALSYEKSLINLLGWISTLPGLNRFSRIAYSIAAQILLRGVL